MIPATNKKNDDSVQNDGNNVAVEPETGPPNAGGSSATGPTVQIAPDRQIGVIHDVATPHPQPPSSASLQNSSEKKDKYKGKGWNRKGKGKGTAHTQIDGIHGSTPTSITSNPAVSSNFHKTLQRQQDIKTINHANAALGTRSKRPRLQTSFEWEAIDIENEKNVHTSGFSASPATMSRNRPRGPATRENGLGAADEEVAMWNKIRHDLTKAKEKNDKQKVVGQQIAALNEKIAKNGNKPTISEIDQLDSLHRQQLKLSDEERAILQEEPSDVLKNLGILGALRSATEADPQGRSIPPTKPRKRKGELDNSATDSPGPSASAVSDKLNRLKSTSQRSGSVSSNQTREGNSSKGDDGAEGTKGTVAEKTGHFFIGAEVVFKHNKKQHGVEGEGIQCIIKSISGEGNKRRYDVQDPEPIENGEEGAVYRTTAASLIPIPQPGSPLPQFQSGKQVLARYPDTTTFYRAEVMGPKKDVYRLKFEGEEDDKEMDVDRRFVLDIPGK